MPQIIYKKYNNDLHLLVWELTETTTELLSMLPSSILTDAEYASISNPEKVREFLASRLSIRTLIALLGIPFDGIKKDEHGKPFMVGNSYELSLTHSKNYMAVAMHPTLPIGIDIEKPSEKLRIIFPRLYTESEILLANDSLETMSIFWSAKEALYKLYGKKQVDFRQNLQISLNERGEFQGEISMPNHKKTHELIIESVGEYLLVLAI